MSLTHRPLRGEVWSLEFDPSVGAEIRKARPAVVMNVAGVGRLPLCIVVPLTDWKPIYARASWMVQLMPTPDNGLTKASAADAFQVKSVSEGRFLRKIGSLTAEQIDAIAEAIALCVGYASAP
jgi:mRNA interferase MazF